MNAAEIVLNNLDSWRAQEPNISKYDLARLMSDSVDNGTSKFYQHGDSVFYVVRVTPFLAELHLFSEEKGTKLIKNMKYFLNEFWETTDFKKLHAIFADKRLCKLAEKTGWELEGTLKKSYMLENGTLQDQFIYGVSKWLV